MSTQLLIGASSGTISSGTTFLLPMGTANSNTEVTRTWIATAAGVLSLLRFDLDVAPGASLTKTLTVRQNLANTTLAVALTGTSAVTGQDTTHSVTVAAGDRISVQHVCSGSASASRAYWTMVFTPTTDGQMVGGGGTGTPVAGNNSYVTLWPTDLGVDTTETNRTCIMGIAGTLIGIGFKVSINSSSGWTMTVYKNGVAQSATVTAAGGVTSSVTATISLAFVATDLISFRFTGAGAGPTIQGIGFSYTPTTAGEFAYGGLDTTGPSASATNYEGVGDAGWNSTAGNNNVLTAPTAGSPAVDVVALAVNVGAAPSAGKSYAFDPYIDSVGGAFTATIANTSQQATATGSAPLGTRLNIRSVPTSTPTATGVISWAFGLSASVTISGALVSTLPHVTAAFVSAEEITGTLASTLPHVTAAFVSAEEITGTLASTLPHVTAAFVSTEELSGTLASTLPHVTAAFASTEELSGTLASTLPHVTAAFASTEELSGTLASTLPHVTAAFASTEELSGILASTLPHVTVLSYGLASVVLPAPTSRSLMLSGADIDVELFLEAAPGKFRVPPIGNRGHPNVALLSASLPHVTAAFAGGVANPITGVLHATLPHVTSRFIGPGSFTAITGTAAATLPHVTSAMVGRQQVAVTGALATQLQMITATFTGPAIMSGLIRSQLSHVTSAGAGYEAFPGHMATTLPHVTATFLSLGVFQGTLASRLPHVTSASAGTEQFPGAMAATLPHVTAAFGGTGGVHGSLASHLPHVTSAFAGNPENRGTLAAHLPHVTSSLVGIQNTLSPPVFTAFNPPNGTVGQAYSYTFTASGNPPPTFAVSPGGVLPPGLSLASNGVLSGTPTTAGSYSFSVSATNSQGTVLVGVPITVTGGVLTLTNPPALPTGLVQGQSFSYQFVASGGVAPYHYFISGGGFPASLTLSVAGLLSGTVIAAPGGSFSGVIDLIDSASPSPTTVQFSFWYQIS